ncbi:MAG: hypothetical protein ACFCD0_12490 [Gemmataceae bacterium]
MKSAQSYLPIVFALLVGLFWGCYGDTLAQARSAARSPFKPYLMIGIAYLVWGIAGGAIGMKRTGASFSFTGQQTLWGFAAGSLGAFGAFSLTMAMVQGGKDYPHVVMAMVFGTAVTVAALIRLVLFQAYKHAKPMLWVGFAGVAACAALVAIFTPAAEGAHSGGEESTKLLPFLFALLVGLFWGSYGDTLAKARPKTDPNPFKPYLMIGLAYLVWGIIGASIGIVARGETFELSTAQVIWGFAAGTLGAFGAFSLTMAMFKGGHHHPHVVMAMVFGTAVTVAAVVRVIVLVATGAEFDAEPWLWVGIAGIAISAAIVALNTPGIKKPAKAPKPEDSAQQPAEANTAIQTPETQVTAGAE